jgi:peptidoglycan hydrolase-like protein with peptidoglycan-binding domain
MKQANIASFLYNLILLGVQMASLKKGSKGKLVNGLQNGLNKAGAKPALKEDGEFGPITEKNVKTFQKKFGLKSDGRVGDLTLATISFGKKLPEMKVGDYAPQGKKWSKSADDLFELSSALYTVLDEIAKLEKIVDGVYDKAEKSMDNIDTYKRIASIAEAITHRQETFRSELIKNPKKAEVKAKECEELERQLKSIGNAKIIPNVRNLDASIKALRNAVSTNLGKVKSAMAGVEKFSGGSYSD